MVRRCAVVAVAALFAVTLSASYAEVTFVMKSGERISGTFSYNHTDHYQLVINGQERSYASDDIAMIAFAPGDPSAAEVDRLPNVNDPPELERHTIVLRNGDMIRGKIWDFQGDRIIMDIRAGDRRTYTMGDTARLYISAPGSRGVFKDVLVGGAGAPGKVKRLPDTNARNLVVSVPGNQAWTNTGLTVNKGDVVTFVASDSIEVGPGAPAGPEGNSALAKLSSYPLKTVNAGALIGRVQTSATGNNQLLSAFPIGGKGGQVAMPATGTLWLGINDNKFTDNSGAFTVKIQR